MGALASTQTIKLNNGIEYVLSETRMDDYFSIEPYTKALRLNEVISQEGSMSAAAFDRQYDKVNCATYEWTTLVEGSHGTMYLLYRSVKKNRPDVTMEELQGELTAEDWGKLLDAFSSLNGAKKKPASAKSKKTKE